MSADDLGLFLGNETEINKAVRLSKDWAKRSLKLQEQFVVMAAKFMLGEILDRIPKGDDADRYKKALKVARVRSSIPAAAITLSMSTKRVRKIDVPKTILYVKRKVSVRRTPPEIEVLERFSPWTVDTLPFQPDEKLAWVVSVKVSEKETQRVARDRKVDKRKWRLELDRAGVREVKRDNVSKRINPKIKAIPDVALLGYRLEFGLGGGKAKPHWRPALRSLVTVGIRKIAKNKAMVNALTHLQYRDWKRWPTKSGVARAKVSRKEVAKFFAFQKRIGSGR